MAKKPNTNLIGLCQVSRNMSVYGKDQMARKNFQDSKHFASKGKKNAKRISQPVKQTGQVIFPFYFPFLFHLY